MFKILMNKLPAMEEGEPVLPTGPRITGDGGGGVGGIAPTSTESCSNAPKPKQMDTAYPYTA